MCCTVRLKDAEETRPKVRGRCLDHPRDCGPRAQLLAWHRGFVSHKKLKDLLSGTERVTLDYDPQYYAEKSSGVLWLALARNVPILAPARTWLRREASRFLRKVMNAKKPAT